MQLDPYIDSVREDLLAAAAVGDEPSRTAATLLSTALAPSLRLALLGALSECAEQISELLGDTTIAITLSGKDIHIAAVDAEDVGPWDAGAAASDDEEPPADAQHDLGRAVFEAGGELSRTTLRIVEKVKKQAEQAASSQGISLNTYIQRAVADSLRAAGRRRGRSS